MSDREALREREIIALERIAAAPRPRNILETIAAWWRREKAKSMRVDY